MLLASRTAATVSVAVEQSRHQKVPLRTSQRASSVSCPCPSSRSRQVVCSFQPFGREILAEPTDNIPVDNLRGGNGVGLKATPQGGASEAGLFKLPALQEPELKLISRFRNSHKEGNSWSSFSGKCKLAWEVFFPSKPKVLSPAGAVKSRLQVILVSDRCGLDLSTLMKIKTESMAKLAQDNGWVGVTELELQVERVRASGERMIMSLPLDSLPVDSHLRDSSNYHYEDGEEGSLLHDDEEGEGNNEKGDVLHDVDEEEGNSEGGVKLHHAEDGEEGNGEERDLLLDAESSGHNGAAVDCPSPNERAHES